MRLQYLINRISISAGKSTQKLKIDTGGSFDNGNKGVILISSKISSQ